MVVVMSHPTCPSSPSTYWTRTCLFLLGLFKVWCVFHSWTLITNPTHPDFPPGMATAFLAGAEHASVLRSYYFFKDGKLLANKQLNSQWHNAHLTLWTHLQSHNFLSSPKHALSFTSYEKLCSHTTPQHVISMVQDLMGKNEPTNWTKDLQLDLSLKEWDRINRNFHKGSANVLVQENNSVGPGKQLQTFLTVVLDTHPIS